MIWDIDSALQGTGMPFPAPHRRKKQAIVTMVKPITSIAALSVSSPTWYPVVYRHGTQFMQKRERTASAPVCFVLLLIVALLHHLAHSGCVIQLTLADTQALRRDLEQLVVRKELQALLQ